jgi:hypothetical protein
MEHSSSETTEQEKSSSGISSLSFVMALIAALVIGGVIGYGLGLVQQANQEPVVVVVTATPDPQAVVQVEPSSAAAQNDPSNTETESDSNNSVPTPTIMDFLLSDARHFQGNSDAPVTIIEFSDFK